MILTPIGPERLPGLVAALARQLVPEVRTVLDRLTESAKADAVPERNHARASALADWFGMKPTSIDPASGYSWDGARVAALTEASVLLHEVAHYQLASPARRILPDFGLGAGPETGTRELADAAQRVHGLAREREEAMASLLGMLWEAELGQAPIHAFQEQNWLEGADRPGTASFFSGVTKALLADGLIDPNGRPRGVLRSVADPPACCTRPHRTVGVVDLMDPPALAC